MIQFFQRYATGRNVLILMAVYIAMVVFVMSPAEQFIKSHSGGTGPIDLVQFYSADKANAMIASYDSEARAFYRSFEFTGDLAYPLVYTLFFGLAFFYVLKKAFPQGHFVHRLGFLPFMPILFDMVENVFIYSMLGKYPDYPAWLGGAASIASGGKWALFFVILALIFTGLLAWAIKSVSRKAK